MTDVTVSIAEHGIHIANLQDDMKEIKDSLHRLESLAAELNAGKKMAVLVAAILGSIATFLGQWWISGPHK